MVTDTHVDPRTIDVDPVDHVDPPMFFRRDVCWWSVRAVCSVSTTWCLNTSQWNEHTDQQKGEVQNEHTDQHDYEMQNERTDQHKDEMQNEHTDQPNDEVQNEHTDQPQDEVQNEHTDQQKDEFPPTSILLLTIMQITSIGNPMNIGSPTMVVGSPTMVASQDVESVRWAGITGHMHAKD